MSKQKPALQYGFSLIELLVSISIIILVLSITLTRQGAFNSAVLLQSEAFDVALAIREIQLSGVSVTSVESGSDFRSAFGVYFAEADENQYILFEDRIDNFYFDGSSEYILGPSIIDPRFEIKSISGSPAGNSVAIIFERPNFDALFYDNANSPMNSSINSIEIVIGMRDVPVAVCGQDHRTIEITRAGQISVQDC